MTLCRHNLTDAGEAAFWYYTASQQQIWCLRASLIGFSETMESLLICSSFPSGYIFCKQFLIDDGVPEDPRGGT